MHGIGQEVEVFVHATIAIIVNAIAGLNAIVGAHAGVFASIGGVVVGVVPVRKASEGTVARGA
jgi:hypothetical protein